MSSSFASAALKGSATAAATKRYPLGSIASLPCLFRSLLTARLQESQSPRSGVRGGCVLKTLLKSKGRSKDRFHSEWSNDKPKFAINLSSKRTSSRVGQLPTC